MFFGNSWLHIMGSRPSQIPAVDIKLQKRSFSVTQSFATPFFFVISSICL